MEQPDKSSNILYRLKERYGTSGVFLLSAIILASYVKVDNFLGLVNMYSIMTPDEIQRVIFSIITFEMVSSIALALLGIIAVYFFVKFKMEALVFSFAFLILQPVVDAIIEIGYSGQVVPGIGALIGGALIFWLFWHFLGNKTSNFLKIKYNKTI